MRIDKFLAEKFGSRNKAAFAVENGRVLVNGKNVTVAYEVKDTDEITFVEIGSTFVSAGGYKLEKALNDFNFDVKGMVFADVGASTGGFTDCLLQRGAKKVYCIDVGESQLDTSLLNENVTVIDNYNARDLHCGLFLEPIEGVVCDVSFISLTYVLNGIASVLAQNGVAFVLIKPQFELEKKDIGKNGIVKQANKREQAIQRVYHYALSCGLAPINLTCAPEIKGKNKEFVLYLKKGANSAPLKDLLNRVNV